MLYAVLQILADHTLHHVNGTLVTPFEFRTSVSTNLALAFAYFSILPITLQINRARPDFKFDINIWLLLIFAAIFGGSRIVLVWNAFDGIYAPTACIKIISAIAAVSTILALWSLVPRFIVIPSTKNLEDLNKQLESKVGELDKALAELQTEKADKERVQNSLLQSQKMEAIGQLTGGIAHDFNNLLLAISGNLELIKCNPSSPRVDRWVGTGIDAVARAAHLTAQLLSFSRVQKLQLKELHIQPLLVNIKEMIVRTIGPDVKVTLSAIENAVILADQVQLELAILNLSLNARDAMPSGGNLTISTTIAYSSLEINVTDTGHGIPDEVVARVFEPFFTTKDIGKGTGLGLSMVYGVARQSGGDVYIKKTSSKGTTITISFPIVAIQTPVEELDEVLKGPVCTSKNILLIDDDVAVCETLEEILLFMGHKVHITNDGIEALAYLKNNQPDLILVDYAMPVMNGATVMKAARLIYADIPTVFVTGFSESAAVEGYTVLKKPFKMKDIEKLLKDVFY